MAVGDPAAFEAQLRRERLSLDLAERAAKFGYWRLDLSDQAYFWSPGMYRLLDADPAIKADPNWIWERIRPEDRVMVEAAIDEAIRTRSPFSYRVRARDPGRVAQIVDTQGEIEIGPDGHVVSVLGVCTDVTERVLAEEAREKAQSQYRLVTEECSDIIMLYAPDRRILFASQALWDLIGRTIPEIELGGYLELVHPDDLPEAVRLRGPSGPGETQTATFRIRHRDGRYVWLEVTTRTLYDSDGQVKNYLSVSRDVTARKLHEIEIKAAQERAETASQAKSAFLANMSHELRTPLNAIIGFTDLMRKKLHGPLGSERYDEYATMIYDSAQLLLDLISDILDMSRIEAGRLELNMEAVDLEDAIEDSLRLVQERADTSGVTLSVAMPERGLSLVADRRALKQVLLNLLSNAIKFTPAGGEVTVVATRIGNRAQIKVKDTGIGIPASELPRLGRPFEQVCADPNLSKTGTGLGLALVRALTERHGGTLGIESEEGVGAEVSVDFPLTAAKSASAA